jgi:hypothetical protein
MRDAGAGFRRAMNGGTQLTGITRRWCGVAAAVAAAALSACASAPPPDSGSALRLERAVAAGLDLYDAREFAVAAERFHEAAREAWSLRDARTEKAALSAECTSWLRARRMLEFAGCTERLEKRHRRSHQPDPGVGTLLALGAIAGERPEPPYRVPSEVAPLIRAARDEGGLR